MIRTRVVGVLLLLSVGTIGWHLIQQPAPATTGTPSTSQAQPATTAHTAAPPTTATRSADEPATGFPSPTGTPLAVTPRPTAKPVQGDVPQDRGTGQKATSRPDQRRVEEEEPSVDHLTDAQLQAALDRQTAGQARLQTPLEHEAAAAAWKQVRLRLTSARTWSHIQQRASVALAIGQASDPSLPVPVNVIISWTGVDPDGATAVHRAETKLLYVDGSWHPLN